MLHGEISHSNLNSVEWRTTELKFEQRSCNYSSTCSETTFIVTNLT